MEKVSLVLLVHNEAEVIEKVVRECHEQVTSQIPNSELVIAEDGSTDGTKEILDRLSKELPLVITSAVEKRGYIKAMKAAFELAKNDLVFFTDGDGQHDPRDFWKLAEQIEQCDMVIGVKSPRQDSLYRVILSRVYNWLINSLFGLRFRDINCGFRLIRRYVIDGVIDETRTLKHCNASEFTIRAHKKGYKIGEIPVTHIPREFGTTKGFSLSILPRVIWELLVGLIKLRVELGGHRNVKEAKS